MSLCIPIISGLLAVGIVIGILIWCLCKCHPSEESSEIKYKEKERKARFKGCMIKLESVVIDSPEEKKLDCVDSFSLLIPPNMESRRQKIQSVQNKQKKSFPIEVQVANAIKGEHKSQGLYRHVLKSNANKAPIPIRNSFFKKKINRMAINKLPRPTYSKKSALYHNKKKDLITYVPSKFMSQQKKNYIKLPNMMPTQPSSPEKDKADEKNSQNVQESSSISSESQSPQEEESHDSRYSPNSKIISKSTTNLPDNSKINQVNEKLTNSFSQSNKALIHERKSVHQKNNNQNWKKKSQKKEQVFFHTIEQLPNLVQSRNEK